MSNLEFWSFDGQYGIQICEEQMESLVRLCQKAVPKETGGILLGTYSSTFDCAIVMNVSPAPEDSQSGLNWFMRGVQGLQKMINHSWYRERRYYLGEWHFHPFGNTLPSQTDINQMNQIANAKQYNCPEPILLIIGGDPEKEWTIDGFVFRRQAEYLALQNLRNLAIVKKTNKPKGKS